MGKFQVGFVGHLYFKNVEKKKTKEIVGHVGLFAGVTGKPLYLEDSKMLRVTVAGDIETELSVLALARAELEQISKRSGADGFELSVAD